MWRRRASEMVLIRSIIASREPRFKKAGGEGEERLKLPTLNLIKEKLLVFVEYTNSLRDKLKKTADYQSAEVYNRFDKTLSSQGRDERRRGLKLPTTILERSGLSLRNQKTTD